MQEEIVKTINVLTNLTIDPNYYSESILSEIKASISRINKYANLQPFAEKLEKIKEHFPEYDIRIYMKSAPAIFLDLSHTMDINHIIAWFLSEGYAKVEKKEDQPDSNYIIYEVLDEKKNKRITLYFASKTLQNCKVVEIQEKARHMSSTQRYFRFICQDGKKDNEEASYES